MVPLLAARLAALWLGAVPAAGPDRPPPGREGRARPAAETALAPLASAEVLAALGPLVPEVGAWAEYLVRSKRGPGAAARARVRLSILPPALPGGRYWLELASATSSGLAVATRILFLGDPTAPRSIERMIVFVAGQAAFELPVEEARGTIGAPGPVPAPGVRVVALGRGRVRVPGGAFLADRLRVVAAGGTTRVDRAAEVPLFGLVRAAGPGGTVELLAFSREGARSLVPPQAGDDLASPPVVDTGGARAGPPLHGNGSESTK